MDRDDDGQGAEQAGQAQAGQRASGFGRGWIPLTRDIGIPGERRVAADVAAEDRLRLAAWVGGEPEAPVSDDRTPSLASLASLASTAHAWTPERQVRFLAFLAENGRVRHAAARVGMSFQSAYVARRRDAAFAQGWDAAMVLARDVAEQALADRAIEGVVETVWYRGEAVGHRRRFDSRLLLAHLARLDAHARSDAPGRAVAGQFDEYLAAMLAGEADPAEHALRVREWPATGWRPLDADRPSTIAEAMREAEAELLEGAAALRAEATDALCAQMPVGKRPDQEAVEDAVLDRLRVAADQARTDSAEQWDAHFAEVTERLDALIGEGDTLAETGDAGELPAEFKSLGGGQAAGQKANGGRDCARPPHSPTSGKLAIAPSIAAHRHRIASGARSPWPLAIGSLRTPCGAFAGPFANPPAPGFGFGPKPGHVADRLPALEPEPSAIRGLVRNAALHWREAAPLRETVRVRLAGRYRRSTGLAAWDGR